MNKIDISAVTTTVGMPVKSGTLAFLQQAYTDLAEAIVKGAFFNGDFENTSIAYVIYGCAITSSGGITAVAPGAIYFNDEIFFVIAQSFPNPTGGNAVVANINTAFFTDATADPVIFTDGSNHNIHQIRTIVFSTAAEAGNVPLPLFTPRPWVSSPIGFGTGFSNLGSAIGAAAYNVAIQYNAIQQIATLSGAVKCASGTITGAGNYTVLGIGAPFIAASQIYLMLDIIDGSSLYRLSAILNTNGQLILSTSGALTAPIILLDGISYRLK